MRTVHRLTISTLSVLLIAAVIWRVGRRGVNSQAQRLPDGTLLRLIDAKIGLTNVFVRGNPLQKVLGDFIPTNGLRLGRFDLQRPKREVQGWSTVPSLSLEFELTGSSNNLAASRLFGRQASTLAFRILHWGDDGFRFVEQVVANHNFQRRPDGWFGYVTTDTFCRSGTTLHVEFQERDPPYTNNWRTIARFAIPHPGPQAPQNWEPEKFPVAMHAGAFSAILGEVKVQWPRDSITRYWDMWQHQVYFPFRLSWDGQSMTNWSVAEMWVADASGNSTFIGTLRSWTNGWLLCSAWRSATPTLPWRISGHFTQDSGFASSNLFRLQIPLSLTGILKTNLGEIPATINFNDPYLTVQVRRTWSIGEFSCWDSSMKPGSRLTGAQARRANIRFSGELKPEARCLKSPPPWQLLRTSLLNSPFSQC